METAKTGSKIEWRIAIYIKIKPSRNHPCRELRGEDAASQHSSHPAYRPERLEIFSRRGAFVPSPSNICREQTYEDDWQGYRDIRLKPRAH